MSTDWDTLIASHAPPSAPPATDRLQGLGTTTPQDGAIAVNHGPSVGLAPDSALTAPVEVKAQANANQWDSIIAAHPAVSSFVGASQTNAALAQNSGPQMASLSGMLSDFAAGTGKWWNRTVADAAADFQAPGLAAQKEVAQAEKTGRWDKLLEGGFGLATALPAGLINNLIAPASRGAASLQPNVLAQTPGPLESTPLPSILTRVLAGEPVFRKDEAQATRDYSTIFNALLMFAPGAKGKIAETGEAAPKPTYTPSPEGPSYNPSGFASDPEGNPFYFASTRDAAQFIRQNAEGNASRFSVHSTNEGVMVHRMGEDVPVPGTSAEGDFAHKAIADMRVSQVSEMQSELAATELHSMAPEKAGEFLGMHPETADAMAHMDPEALLKLTEDGHEAFQDLAPQITEALQTGREVSVPLSRYLTETAGKPFAEELNAATRFGEDGVSVNQGRELGKSEVNPSTHMSEYVSNWRGDETGLYDPAFFTKELDHLTDEHGVTIATKDKIVPKDHLFSDFPFGDSLPRGNDLLYRGMSAAEFDQFQKTGVLKSAGTHNIGEAQKGLTYYTTDPNAAVSYSNGYAPSIHKPAPGKPAYVVAIKHPGTEHVRAVKGTAGHEVGLTKAFSKDEVVAAYKGTTVAYRPGINKGGVTVAPSATLHWEKMGTEPAPEPVALPPDIPPTHDLFCK